MLYTAALLCRHTKGDEAQAEVPVHTSILYSGQCHPDRHDRLCPLAERLQW